MIPDKNLQLWSGAVPALGSVSNVIDIDTLRNIGVGVPLYVRVNFDTNVRATSSGLGAITLYLTYGENQSLSNPTYSSTFPVSVNSSSGPNAGEVVYIPIPPIHTGSQGTGLFSTPNASKKYFGVVFGGYDWTDPTGSLTIDIVTEINRVENIYAGGFSVK